MAAAPSSLGTHFKEELSCSICLELFTRPKVLPCGHTFCQDCLQGLAGRGWTLQCSICRRKVRLPPQGVADLPNSHIIASICETLQQQTTLSGETREQTQSGNQCSFHPSEVIRLYCKHCQIPICEQCLEEAHDDHCTTTIKKAAHERSSTVRVEINEGRDILESYLGFLRSLSEEEKTLDEQKQQRDNSIIQAYNQTVQKLTERKDHLLSESAENHTKDLDRIQTKKDRVLADANELSAACDRAEQELEQGWVDFLSLEQTALTEVVGKYRQKAALTPVETQPAVFQPKDTPVPVLGHVTFGGEGSVTGQFKDPFSVTVSYRGIFVAEYANQRIQNYTLQRMFFGSFPTVVSGEQKMDPHDVATDGEGNLWVVGRTYSADFAVQYSERGGMLKKFELQKTGRVRGVAVDTRRNHILITQTTGDRPNLHGEVQVFSPDGTLVRTVGQQQGMKFPKYITLDRERNILVSDCENHCVYVYTKNGEFLFQFGGEGFGSGHMSHPQGICTDRLDNIYVADYGNRHVQKFDKTGKFLELITTGMKKPSPQDVAMTANGQLVITDVKNDKFSIHVYSKS